MWCISGFLDHVRAADSTFAYAAQGVAGSENTAQKKPEWKPSMPDPQQKPKLAVLMNKGVGNDNLLIKQVSVADQNNVWCIAHNGVKDSVYQVTPKGLVYQFDGVWISAGLEIVTAITANNEVFELEFGPDAAWKKIDGLLLSHVSRPSKNVGWGVLYQDSMISKLFRYDLDKKRWISVKNVLGNDVDITKDVQVNAENIALVLTNQNELLKRDLEREELFDAAKTQANQAVSVKNKKKKTKKGVHHNKKRKKQHST